MSSGLREPKGVFVYGRFIVYLTILLYLLYEIFIVDVIDIQHLV